MSLVYSVNKYLDVFVNLQLPIDIAGNKSEVVKKMISDLENVFAISRICRTLS